METAVAQQMPSSEMGMTSCLTLVQLMTGCCSSATAAFRAAVAVAVAAETRPAVCGMVMVLGSTKHI